MRFFFYKKSEKICSQTLMATPTIQKRKYLRISVKMNLSVAETTFKSQK